MFLEETKKLGTQITERLYQANRDIGCLSDIAYDLLKEFPCWSHEEILADLARNLRQIGNQSSPNHNFGDQRFTLYTNPDFIIELNVWQTQLTNIHEHSFTGAFKIIAGEAIHSLFDFKKEEKLNEHVQLGELKKRSTIHMRTGSLSKIEIGENFIHKLIHIKNPTTTLIIRSIHNEPTMIYQRDFVGSRLAIFGWYYSNESHNAVSWIKTAFKLDVLPECFEENLVGIMGKLNPVDIVFTVHQIISLFSDNHLKVIAQILSKKLNNEEKASMLIDSLVESKNDLSGGLRDKITNDTVRSILAILSESSNADEALNLYKSVTGQSITKTELCKISIELMHNDLRSVSDEMYEEIIKCLPYIFDEEFQHEENVILFRKALEATQLRPLLK